MDPSAHSATHLKVAYVTSRFPKISETFILFEMEEIGRMGIDIALYALVRERPTLIHPEAARWVDRAKFGTWLSRELIAAQWFWLRRRIRPYLGAWLGALAMNITSPRFLARALFIVPNAAMFARSMVHGGTDHIHAHYATHPALTAWVASRLTGVQYSVTAHAHDVYVNTTGLKRKVTDANFVVAVSEFNARLLERLAPEAYVEVVRTGTDPGVFYRDQPVSRAEAFTIVAVGSLEPYKGHRYLLEAARLLHERGERFRCLIVGDGPERPRLERLIQRYGMVDYCRLLGVASRETVRKVLMTADALVLPSITTPSGKMEGLPVVLMEAMAMQVPVIASRLSGIPELVIDDETGLLVPEGDPSAIASAVQRLAGDDALRQRLARNGREMILQSFDRRNSARTLASLFRDRAA